MKNSFPAILFFSLFILVAWSFYTKPNSAPKNFSACAGEGYTILETGPRQCLAPSDQVFSENLTEFEKLAKTASSSETLSDKSATSSQPTATSSIKEKPPIGATSSQKTNKIKPFSNP